MRTTFALLLVLALVFLASVPRSNADVIDGNRDAGHEDAHEVFSVA